MIQALVETAVSLRPALVRETPALAAVASTQGSQADLGHDTQGALLRFARFVHDEKNQRRKPSPQIPSTGHRPKIAQHACYALHASSHLGADRRGVILDIRV